MYAEPLTAFHWFGLRPDGSVEEETNDTNSDDEASEDSSSSGSRKRAIREKRLLKQDHDAVYDTNMIEYGIYALIELRLPFCLISQSRYAWKVILRNHAHSRINDNTVAEVNRETEERFGKYVAYLITKMKIDFAYLALYLCPFLTFPEPWK